MEGRGKGGRKEIGSRIPIRAVKAIKIPGEFIESFLRLFRSWIRQPRNYIILEHQAAVNYGFIGAA